MSDTGITPEILSWTENEDGSSADFRGCEWVVSREGDLDYFLLLRAPGLLMPAFIGCYKTQETAQDKAREITIVLAYGGVDP